MLFLPEIIKRSFTGLDETTFKTEISLTERKDLPIFFPIHVLTVFIEKIPTGGGSRPRQGQNSFIRLKTGC